MNTARVRMSGQTLRVNDLIMSKDNKTWFFSHIDDAGRFVTMSGVQLDASMFPDIDVTLSAPVTFTTPRDVKEREVIQRLKEIGPHANQLVPIMDDWQLDMLLLVFGLGEVVKK